MRALPRRRVHQRQAFPIETRGRSHGLSIIEFVDEIDGEVNPAIIIDFDFAVCQSLTNDAPLGRSFL